MRLEHSNQRSSQTAKHCLSCWQKTSRGPAEQCQLAMARRHGAHERDSRKRYSGTQAGDRARWLACGRRRGRREGERCLRREWVLSWLSDDAVALFECPQFFKALIRLGGKLRPGKARTREKRWVAGPMAGPSPGTLGKEQRSMSLSFLLPFGALGLWGEVVCVRENGSGRNGKCGSLVAGLTFARSVSTNVTGLLVGRNKQATPRKAAPH